MQPPKTKESAEEERVGIVRGGMERRKKKKNESSEDDVAIALLGLCIEKEGERKWGQLISK